MMLFSRYLTLVIILLAHQGFAQSAKLKEARQLQSKKDYENSLRILKEELIQNSEDGGTWFTYAEVQYALSQRLLSNDDRRLAFQEAIIGYQKTIEYQDDLSRIYAVAKTQLQEIPPQLLDEGIQFYSAKSYEEAVEKFSFANIAQPKDTVALIYGVSAANQGQLYEEAYSFYEKLIDIKPKEQYYQNMFIIQKERMGNTEKALLIIDQAKEDFPENYSFKKYEIDLFIILNRKAEALELLMALTNEYPNNMGLLLNKAMLLDEGFKARKDQLDSVHYDQEMELIVDAYTAVLAISPRHPLANFNMALLYSDHANHIVKELNGMNAASFATNVEAYKENMNNALVLASQYMEAAKKSQPKNLNILKALKLFYDRLEWTEKSDAIQEEIIAISG